MFQTTIECLTSEVAELEKDLEGIEAQRKEVKRQLRQATSILKKLAGDGSERPLKAVTQPQSNERPQAKHRYTA